VILGDICDRGDNALWVALFAAAAKLSDPNVFYLLRGNHETSEMNKISKDGTTTLQSECHRRFGIVLGNEWWEMLNKFFKCLPYALSINNPDDPTAKGYSCFHGGPCPTLPRLASWNKVPREDRESHFYHVMWDDPHPNDSFEGYERSKRGVVANFFGQDVLDYFLDVNWKSSVFRGHGHAPDGVKETWNGKVRTITSNHSQGTIAGAVFIESSLEVNCLRWKD
jgi:diadenosine tetraphosphatase ApaH/serine/threonine PP2A family protein phosphatase